MILRNLCIVAGLVVLSNITLSNAQIRAQARWCVVNDLEMSKCSAVIDAINQRTLLNRTMPPTYNGKPYSSLPQFMCVQGSDQYDCMNQIYTGSADLTALETGLSYTAGEFYNMMPLVAEKYFYSQDPNDLQGLSYYAVVVVRADNPWTSVDINSLKGKKACMTGVGRAAGWIYPVSTLMQDKVMDIVECNVPVKSAAAFFGDMCAPDGLARYYNPFGNNPVTICENCKGVKQDYCTCNDPYAGYAGAFNCMASGDGDIAFVRNTTLYQYLKTANTSLTKDSFQLICPDGSRASVDAADKCNWGTIASHIVMTSAVRDSTVRADYKALLNLLSLDFGDSGTNSDLFQIFESIAFGQQDLMFTDETTQLLDVSLVPGKDTYYTWAGDDLRQRLIVLNSCPLQQARWCVISSFEMLKCEKMIMAFAAKNLKPDLNCVLGIGAQDCMQKISRGDADMITLDAADVYVAGMNYGLIPLASEDYSGTTETPIYYAVAVARRRDSFLTLFNLKQRRACYAGVMTGSGWVIPVDKLIETGQIHFTDCNAYLAVSQYFSKLCVPGVLDDYYNPYGTNPVNLCEACATSGPHRCMRNDEELYYGSSGAFRCLTEMGGDIAFVRHTTVRENTDGRNVADWSRNRRSDDYELLCPDGTRSDIDGWFTCNLGPIPPNAVMTAGFKTSKEREIFWTLLNFAQQFYDADTNPDFAMFDSMVDHKDLLFQDATIRLVLIDSKNQDYMSYLQPEFIRAMERMHSIDCVTGQAIYSAKPISIFSLTLAVITVLLT